MRTPSLIRDHLRAAKSRRKENLWDWRKKRVRVLNYYDKHLCKYAEFFVGFYNQSPGVTITEDTWVIYVPWCPARDGEMIAAQRLRWGQWEAHRDQSEVSWVTLQSILNIHLFKHRCIFVKGCTGRARAAVWAAVTKQPTEMKKNSCHFQLIPR